MVMAMAMQLCLQMLQVTGGHCHHMAVINRVGSGSSSRGSGRGSGEDFEVYNCHENHLLHLHKGAGAIRDARRGYKGRVLSPL